MEARRGAARKPNGDTCGGWRIAAGTPPPRALAFPPMTAAATAPSSQDFDLYIVRSGNKRYWWRNPNAGVTITDAGRESRLNWRIEGRAESRLWTDIVAVTLSSATAGKNAINHCRIDFRDGGWLLVTDGGATGLLDESRTATYRAFVRALNARLAQAPAGTISFNAGVAGGRYKAMQISVAIAVLFFVGLPVVLLFIVRDWHILGILAAGAALVWPFWKVLDNNRPRSYDPRQPPGELME
jgi:hypothetical protein